MDTEALANAIARDYALGRTLAMTFGEIFLVVFITTAILSASWWARAGESVALLLGKGNSRSKRRSGTR